MAVMLSSKTHAFSRLRSPDVTDEVPRAELLFQKVTIELFGESQLNVFQKSQLNCEKLQLNCFKNQNSTLKNHTWTVSKTTTELWKITTELWKSQLSCEKSQLNCEKSQLNCEPSGWSHNILVFDCVMWLFASQSVHWPVTRSWIFTFFAQYVDVFHFWASCHKI